MKKAVLICLIYICLFFPTPVFAILIKLTDVELMAVFGQAGLTIDQQIGLTIDPLVAGSDPLEGVTDQKADVNTDQSGVNIEIEYANFKESLDELAYTDEDGTNGVAGAFVVRDRYHELKINGITSEEDFKKRFSEATGGVEPLSTWNDASKMVINIGACESLTEIEKNRVVNDSTLPVNDAPIRGLVVKLPTLLMRTVIDEYSIGVAMAGAANDGANYGRITIQNNVVAILGGTVEIAVH